MLKYIRRYAIIQPYSRKFRIQLSDYYDLKRNGDFAEYVSIRFKKYFVIESDEYLRGKLPCENWLQKNVVAF